MDIKVDINVCRVCLKSVKRESGNSDKSLLEKFQYATLLKVDEDDGIPTNFCEPCISRLKISYDFRRLSIVSDTYMRAFINKMNTEFKQVAMSASNSIKDLYNVKDEEIDLLLKEDKSNGIPIPIDEIHHVKLEGPTVTIIEDKIVKNCSIIETNFEQITTVTPIEVHNRHHHQGVTESEEVFTKYIQEDDVGGTNYIEDSEDCVDCNEDDDIHENINNVDEGDADEDNFNNEIIKHQEVLLMTNEEIGDNMEELTLTNNYDNENIKNQIERIPTPVLLTTTAAIYQNSVKNENRTHICIKCDKDFSTKTNLMRHMLTHDGVKPYQCTICGNGFTQSGSLKSHMLIHTGERPHRCEVCGRGFTQSKSLTLHMRRHTGEKPFTCITCGLNFRQKDGLKRHIQIKHSGMSSESHQCTICDRILHSKYSLALHKRKHSHIYQQQLAQHYPDKKMIDINIQQTDKKSFKCDQCNKEFSKKSSYTAHKKVHNERQQIKTNDNNSSNSKVFQCGKCFKSFSIKRNLIQHLRNHNIETLDLFKCESCSIAFNTKRGLKLHRYNEHKEIVSDLNECDICNIPFVSVHDLNQHIINVHDNIDEKCGICLQRFTSKKLYEDHILEHEMEEEYTIS